MLKPELEDIIDVFCVCTYRWWERATDGKRLTDETDITGFVATKGLKKLLRYVKEEIDLAAVQAKPVTCVMQRGFA